MIVISGEFLKRFPKAGNPIDVLFTRLDKEGVFTLLDPMNLTGNVSGSIHFAGKMPGPSIFEIGKDSDQVRVIVEKKPESSKTTSMKNLYEIKGYVRQEASWSEVPVQVVPVREELFSRFGSLLETDVLANKSVFVVGVGSGGAPICIELAKSGVMNFYLMDHDRLEVANISRHVAGLPHVGRYKTKVMAGLIREKNPYATAWTYEQRADWENVEEIREIVKKTDIVICATDNKPSKLLINRICVQEGKPCIFAGAFRRAYGGQILFVKPGQTLCYQCFCMLLPEQSAGEEISSVEQSERLAYTDRPVPIEPGLSTDIAPISLMVVKLVIQALLKGTETTLRSLDDDLAASWYLWLNRRETGTQYETLEPLEFNIDGMHVLRWYGVKAERHPACPVCGDFEGHLAREKGLDLSFADLEELPGCEK